MGMKIEDEQKNPKRGDMVSPNGVEEERSKKKSECINKRLKTKGEEPQRVLMRKRVQRGRTPSRKHLPPVQVIRKKCREENTDGS